MSNFSLVSVSHIDNIENLTNPKMVKFVYMYIVIHLTDF